MQSVIQGRSSRTHTSHSDRIIPKPPMTKTLSIALVSTCLFALLVALLAATAPSTNPREAARLNNIGVAYMNQQLFEKALKAFEEAAAKDPALEVATVNRGVALLNLQRIDEAKALLAGTASVSIIRTRPMRALLSPHFVTSSKLIRTTPIPGTSWDRPTLNSNNFRKRSQPSQPH